MCINVEVVIPTIEKFLVFYSLRLGSIIILSWTTFRSLFCIVFFSSAILELLIGKGSPFGSWLVHDEELTENTYIVYYALIMLLLCETIILLFMIHFASGLFYILASITATVFIEEIFNVISIMNLTLKMSQYTFLKYKTHLLEHYLTCRLVMWFFEITGLIVLCLVDKILIGWYLSILFFVILESYSLIVVYSYYVKFMADYKEP